MPRTIDYGIPEMSGVVVTIVVTLHYYPLRFPHLLGEVVYPGGYCQGIIFFKEYRRFLHFLPRIRLSDSHPPLVCRQCSTNRDEARGPPYESLGQQPQPSIDHHR